MEKSHVWKPVLPPYRRYKKAMHQDPVVTGDFIYQIGESPALRLPSTPVDLSKLHTKEYKDKITYLKRCMREYKRRTNKGSAISAVQVGISEQMIVVYCPEKQHEQEWILLNPRVINQSPQRVLFPEMCMSCNSLIAPIIRPSWVEIAYFSENGEQRLWNTKDITKKQKMYNRVLQHEIDHLHGIINIDLIPSSQLIFISDPHFYEKASFEKVF